MGDALGGIGQQRVVDGVSGHLAHQRKTVGHRSIAQAIPWVMALPVGRRVTVPFSSTSRLKVWNTGSLPRWAIV